MRRYLMTVVTLTALCGASMPAHARPPTVMNSPGYDARLQESRKALGNPSTAPTPGTSPVTTPKKSKKKHTN